MNETTPKDRWLGDYRIKPGLVRLQAALAILSLLAAAGTSAWVLFSWFYAVTRYGPASVWNWIRVPLLLTGFLIPLFLYFLLRWNSLSRILVRTHSRGIQIHRRGKRISLPWNAITELHTSFTRYGIGSLVWKKKNMVRLKGPGMRRPITIPDNLENLEDLVNTIRTYVYTRLGAEIDQLLSTGDTAVFGPIQVSNQTLTVSGNTISWADLHSLNLQDGSLKLVLSGQRPRTVKLRASRIPNLDLCCQLIRKMSGV